MQVNKTNYFHFPPFVNRANNLAQNSLKIRNLSNIKRPLESNEKQNPEGEKTKGNKISYSNKKLDQLPQSRSLAQLGPKIIPPINSPIIPQMGILHSKSPIRGLGKYPLQSNYNFSSSKYQLNFDPLVAPPYNSQSNLGISSGNQNISHNKFGASRQLIENPNHQQNSHQILFDNPEPTKLKININNNFNHNNFNVKIYKKKPTMETIYKNFEPSSVKNAQTIKGINDLLAISKSPSLGLPQIEKSENKDKKLQHFDTVINTNQKSKTPLQFQPQKAEASENLIHNISKMVIQNNNNSESSDMSHIPPETQRNFHSNSTKATNNPLVFKPVKNLRRSVGAEARNNLNSNVNKEKNVIQLNDLKIIDRVKSYAVKSKTGFIPTKPDKINQDTYFVIRHFGSIKNFWYFGVCDGHGVNGHYASDYVKQKLPFNMRSLMELKENDTLSAQPQTGKMENDPSKEYLIISGSKEQKNETISKAFMKTNNEVNSRSFNVSFSGTTAVTVMLIGNQLICANVGDSRAILAFQKTLAQLSNLPLPKEYKTMPQDEKIWVALPLSRDHKPEEDDEKKRIISNNGRIEPFREPNGAPIGPSRVWLQVENIPGLAMTRSFGDKVASSVGVISEPEIFETTLSADDKFLVIASDGIWEFLPNDEVVEMIVPYYEQNNPEGACDHLIREAIMHWREEDEVIDDITILVIFLH